MHLCVKFYVRWLWSVFFFVVHPVFAAAEPPEVIIQSLTKLIPRLNHAFSELERGDLVVLDLDNTVFREVQMLGTDEWYSHIIHTIQQEQGLSATDAMNFMEPINNAIKTESKMRLMEVGIPTMIRDLQSRGVYVIGLTARHPTLADTTIEHLVEHGIYFERSQFPADRLRGDFSVPGLSNAFLWRGGVAFTDGSPKGTILEALVRTSGVNPKQIIAVDDRIKHVQNIIESMLEMGIGGRVIHYLKVREERAFDPEIADLQFRTFKRLGVLISDEEATVLLKQDCEKILSVPATNDAKSVEQAL